MDSSEEQLPALLATDLKRNFERLVLAYQDRLYAFVLSRVHNTLAAEEIVQTAFRTSLLRLANVSSATDSDTEIGAVAIRDYT